MIKSVFDNGRPNILVSINGIENFKLLVDTGAATLTLFDSPKVKNLGLEKGYTLKKSGWGDDGASKAYQSTLKRLSLGDVTFENIHVGYLQAAKSPYLYSPDELVFDGIIGYDLMRHFGWQFDMQNNQIIISKQPHQARSNETALKLDTFMTRIHVDSEINFGHKQVSSPLIVDTGSRHYLKLGTEFLRSHDVELTEPNVTAADFGLSGMALHKRMNLPSLKLGDQTFNNIKTNIIRTDDDDELLVIGNALLNQFITTVDYHTETMYLRPYPDPTFTVRYNLFGLKLGKLISGNFVARFISPDLPVHNIDIKVGDVITSIDNVPSKDISTLDWQTIRNKEGKHEICRLRGDSNQCFSIEAKHIKGFSSFD